MATGSASPTRSDANASPAIRAFSATVDVLATLTLWLSLATIFILIVTMCSSCGADKPQRVLSATQPSVVWPEVYGPPATVVVNEAGRLEEIKRHREVAAEESMIQSANNVGWVGRVALWVGALLFIVSWLPWLPMIPKGLAGGCLIVAGAGAFGQYWLLRYGSFVAQTTFWLCLALGILGGVAVLVPLVISVVRGISRRSGARLIQEGRVRDGVALMAKGDSKINRNRKIVASLLEQRSSITTAGAVALAKMGVPIPATSRQEGGD